MATSAEDMMRLMGITDSIREIDGYMGNAGYEDFVLRDDTRQAVAANLAQIGGAASLLSDEFKEEHNEVDWDVLNGLQYVGFDEELELDAHQIWYLVKEDLPVINDQLLDLVTTLEDDYNLDEVALNEEDKRDIQDRYREMAKVNEQLETYEDINMVQDAPERNEEQPGHSESDLIETSTSVRKGPFHP
jgi:uncharacterized protein with HEPN domain